MSSPPFLVLLDFQMRRLSGWHFRDVPLYERAIAGVPVAALSGHGGIAQQAAVMQMVGYLSKPAMWASSEILRRICQLAL